MTTITLLTIAQLRALNTHSAAAIPPRGPVCSFYYRCLAFRIGKKKKCLLEEEQTASTAKIMLTHGLNVAVLRD